jgi:hypothetical protein
MRHRRACTIHFQSQILGNTNNGFHHLPYRSQARPHPDHSDDGTTIGYGSVFGNVDSYGDIVAKGAFKKTINLQW